MQVDGDRDGVRSDSVRVASIGMFSSLSCGPWDFSSKGSYSQRNHISVPSHNKTVTFSTARDVGVTERLTSLSPT